MAARADTRAKQAEKTTFFPRGAGGGAFEMFHISKAKGSDERERKKSGQDGEHVLCMRETPFGGRGVVLSE